MATSDQVPEGTAQDVLDWVGSDPTRARAALDAERAGQNRSTLITRLESIAAKEATAVSDTTTEAEAAAEAPEGNAPAPVPPAGEDLSVDLYDRATVVGPANVVEGAEKPDDAYDLVKAEAEEESPIDAEPVEFFQVVSNGGVVVIRFDDSAVLLDAQQALALQRDLRGALAGVTY